MWMQGQQWNCTKVSCLDTSSNVGYASQWVFIKAHTQAFVQGTQIKY